MTRLVDLRDQFHVEFANDTDADRHGIVTRGSGLLKPNDYLAVAITYRIANRPSWPSGWAIGKTFVTSSMIDRIAAKHGHMLLEVPVGYKWFAEGLLGNTIASPAKECRRFVAAA